VQTAREREESYRWRCVSLEEKAHLGRTPRRNPK
jgi:hypothetical protein